MSDIRAPALRSCFDEALRGAGAARPGDAVFDDLVTRDGEPHRHYHTIERVSSCLEWLGDFAGLASHPAEGALALWFHDAIYDPRADDNERRSAELARLRLGELGVPAAVIDRIEAHILATRRHDAESGDSALVVDIDLAILGSSPAEFDVFEQRIRREYAHIPDALFSVGRRTILQRFLDRPAIYRTDRVCHARGLRPIAARFLRAPAVRCRAVSGSVGTAGPVGCRSVVLGRDSPSPPCRRVPLPDPVVEALELVEDHCPYRGTVCELPASCRQP
jgi:predicted metal-dependent HD superfamily phosphohydrolase